MTKGQYETGGETPETSRREERKEVRTRIKDWGHKPESPIQDEPNRIAHELWPDIPPYSIQG